MTWRLGPVDPRTGGGRPPVPWAWTVPRRPQGLPGVLALLGVLAGALLLAVPAPAPASAVDTCANAEYRTGAAAKLPDCRAYELVTLADKAGLSFDANTARLATSQIPTSLGAYQTYMFGAVSGDAFYMTSRGAFAGARGPHHSNVVTVRTAAGWRGRSSSPPPCSADASGIFAGANIAGLSAHFSLAAYDYSLSDGGISADCDPDDHGGADVYSVARSGALDWGPPVWVSQNGKPKTSTDAAGFAGMSADGSHVLFGTDERLLPVDAGRETGSGLYDRVAGRTVAVGLKSDGSPVNVCGARLATPLIGDGAGTDSSAPWPVAVDNRTIFFYAGSSTSAAYPGCSPTSGNGGQLFARIDGSRTVQLSRSQRTVPEAQALPTFVGATPDGRHVYFRSTERLTDQATAGGGLYEYDLTDVLLTGAATGTLTFLSPSADGNPADVTRLLDVTDDGSVVTFTARGVLAAGTPAAGTKVYQVRDDQTPRLVAAPHQSLVDRQTVSVSPDGSQVAYLDTDPTPGAVQQVYLVRASAPATAVCVSCPPSGAIPTGPATFKNTGSASAWPRVFGANPFVTDDGRVFFGSSDQLTRQDGDSAWDVYAYRDGVRTLVTPGTGPRNALLLGMGPDGRDVFFSTTASLVAEDFDNGDADVYTARIGGGFPQPPPAPIPCAGDECQPPTPAPTLAAPGSVGFVAPFAAPRVTPAPKPSAKKVSVKRPKTVRGATKVRLSVKVPEAGRIRVSGSGLRRAKATAKRAKTYRVTVRLSQRSQRILKRKHRVRVRATVRFTPDHGKRSRVRVHVTFKRKQHHGEAKRRSHEQAHGSAGKGGR